MSGRGDEDVGMTRMNAKAAEASRVPSSAFNAYDLQSAAQRRYGLGAEELQRRKAEAAKPRVYVSDTSHRAFAVRSTTRAKQVMTEGLIAREHTQRQQTLQMRTRQMWWLRVGLLTVSFAGVGVFAYVCILPHLAAIRQRRWELQLRQQRVAGARASLTMEPTSDTRDTDKAARA